jgi:uncharacterized protein (TIGR03435 family)
MKPDSHNTDDLIARHLPSASPFHVEAAGARVLQRLRSASEQEIEDAATELLPAPAGPAWWQLAAAAALVIAAVTAAMFWKSSATRVAVVSSVDTSLSRDVDGRAESIAEGSGVETDQPVRTTGDAGAVLTLTDGSSVEMRSQSELAVERAADGLDVHLHKGSVIVHAAKQRQGHLYVTTKDVRVSVVGTVFLVRADAEGSRVGVIEGEVHVREGAVETSLRQGQQVTSNRGVAAQPLRDEIAWSRNAPGLMAILDSFTRGMAISAGPLEPLAKAPGATQGGGVAAAPQFEEASVRPCDPDNIPEPPAGSRGGGANSLQMTPGRMHGLCLTLATLIRTAFGYAPADLFANGGRARGFNYNAVYGLGVEDGRRVRGGPDWVRSERYTIDAVAADASDAETMSRAMLRALLEKRFQLQAHIESEQIPAFDLTAAPGGLKMKEGVCTPADVPPAPGTPRSSNDVVRKNLDAARRGATTAFPCGMVFAVNGPNILLVGAGAGLPALGGLFGVPVTDKTGIPATARFNYALEFAPDASMTGPLGRVVDAAKQGTGPNVQIAADPSAVPPAPNLFTALEQQLGLKLEPARAPREFIVIDRVERPTPN